MTPQRIKDAADALDNILKSNDYRIGYKYGYIAGATAEHDRVQPVIEAAEKVAKLFAHKDGNCAICELARAIEQWRGKEPQQPEPQPDLGTCVECGTRKAVLDYNGHQYYVCDPCNNRLNREFDKEYY